MKNRLTLVVLVCLFSTSGAPAALVSTIPTADGFALSSTAWTSIDSSSPDLLAQLVDPEGRSALEFDISGLPAGAAVNSATLNLTGVTADANIGVHGYTGNGTLEAADFSLTNEITQFDPQIGLNVVDVTGFVQAQYAAASPFAGFQLRELVQNEVTQFASNEFAESQSRPHLDIDYTAAAVPEPSTLALAALGLAGFALAMNRLRNVGFRRGNSLRPIRQPGRGWAPGTRLRVGMFLTMTAVTYLVGVPRAALAAPIVTVDQEQTSATSFLFSIPGFSPVGQEFTPSLPGLDAIELQLAEVSGGLGADVFVQIRDGSIGGAILGTSSIVSLPDGILPAVFHFDFASTVPLTPGNLYVIEAIQASGDEAIWAVRLADVYAGGTAIATGNDNASNYDFWFREGLHSNAVPEPSTLALGPIGLAGLGLVAWRRRKRS